MTQKNRELSQFGSFLEVNNTNKNIGIATTGTPYIGIGTIDPQYKLHIVGDTNIDGTIYVSGTPIAVDALQTWELDGSNVYRESGSVGIGTSTYTAKLSVSGDAYFLNEVTASQFISTVTTGTAPFQVTSSTQVTNLNASLLSGKTAPSGSIVGTSDGQTLTNKTLNLSSNTLTGTTAQFNATLSDDDFATLAAIQTLTNKTLTTPIISGIRPSAGQLQNVPSGSGTLVSTNSVGVITTGMIADGTITSIDISSGAGITNGQLANSTISGISLGSNLNSLTAGSYITYNSGSTYNGSTAITISANGSSSNTANTLVARNASGDFTAGSITCTNLTASTAVTVNGTNLLTTIEQKASTGKAIAMAMIFG